EDARLREPCRALRGADRPDRGGARQLPPGLHAPGPDLRGVPPVGRAGRRGWRDAAADQGLGRGSDRLRAMPPPQKRRRKVEPKSHGLTAAEVGSGEPSDAAKSLARAIEDDGGAALATYRDPLGGHWQVLAALPIDAVEPTPFQRDLSDTHVKRLTGVLGAL